MSLTSYRAAPPRVEIWSCVSGLPRVARFICSGRRGWSPSRSGLTPMGWLFGSSFRIGWTGRPGGDLLSRALRHSTMGAGGFHGRVREGIGCGPPAKATRSSSPSNCAVFRPPGVEPASGSRLSFTGRVVVRPAGEVLVCVLSCRR